MAPDVFTVPEVMRAIEPITDREENRYSDIPHWEGSVMSWTDKALCVRVTKRQPDGSYDVWLPLSQLRKAGDEQSIYASDWILEQKGLG